MSKNQAPFTFESFESSTRADYGWSDRLPTRADLAGMLKELADELDLGNTPRSKHLATKIQKVTFIVEPIVSKNKRRDRNGDQVEVIRYRSGRRTAIVHDTDGTKSIRSHGLRRTVEADQLCSDLEITFRLCRDLLRGIPDPARLTKLRTLSERFEAKEQQRKTVRRSSPILSLNQFGKALGMDPYRDFKVKAKAEWGLMAEGAKWSIDYNMLDDPGKESQIDAYAREIRDAKEKK